MQYGFAIDHRTCIGCHACTVACKTEHQIPVGQFRTWVKYVDSGTFPESTRDFGIMRCNHCTDAPCVQICPTSSLFKREDGIVDFDGERCIGCKSCMQACPYDAIYIDEDTHTAAKCNFCAHRVDSGLEPACVVVCPTHSIWVGDVDDPDSGISRLITDNPVTVRAPEQGTGPNVFYLAANPAVLDPLAAPVDETYIYSRPDEQRLSTADIAAPTDARTTLNTAHPRPWGWRVTTYLWTKAVAAGALMVAALGWFLGVDVGTVLAPALGLAGIAVTGGLLVWDLKRPERFLYILLKANPTSWLFWGSVALGLGALVSLVWLVLGTSTVVAALAIPAGLATAGYTAFLFGQAEGRDLWQSRLLLPHLIVQAFLVGAGALLLVRPGDDLLAAVLVVAAVAHVLLLLAEYGRGHHRPQAAFAARLATHGRYRRDFYLAAAAVVLGAVLAPFVGIAAGLLVQAGVLGYESVYVRAGQDAPLS